MLRFHQIAFAFGLALVAGTVPADPAGAVAGDARAGSVGNDVSYPECGRPVPTGGEFGIVGITGGRPFTANPCLGAEQTWASGLPDVAMVYLNTSNPGPVSSRWPGHGASDPARCVDETSTSDPGCAY